MMRYKILEIASDVLNELTFIIRYRNNEAQKMVFKRL